MFSQSKVIKMFAVLFLFLTACGSQDSATPSGNTKTENRQSHADPSSNYNYENKTGFSISGRYQVIAALGSYQGTYTGAGSANDDGVQKCELNKQCWGTDVLGKTIDIVDFLCTGKNDGTMPSVWSYVGAIDCSAQPLTSKFYSNGKSQYFSTSFVLDEGQRIDKNISVTYSKRPFASPDTLIQVPRCLEADLIIRGDVLERWYLSNGGERYVHTSMRRSETYCLKIVH